MPTLYRDGACLIVRPDGIASPLERIEFSASAAGAYTEAWLQDRIHLHPECLPIGEIEAGFGKLRSIAKEVPAGGGYIDNLLMSGEGDIAVAEVKLFRNHEARRQVLAQILDYAATLFGMDYSSFEQAVLKGTTLRDPKASLYGQFEEGERLKEADFIDAVSRNLASGRMLLLIVGDGIRTELQRLVEQLEAFGQMRFTLAIVELAVHRLPEGGYLIRPGILAKTEFVKRPVLEIVKAPDLKSGLASIKTLEQQRPDDMTSADYWTVLEEKVKGSRVKLEAFLKNMDSFGVYPEFKASLNIKWEPPEQGKRINLGYIQRNSVVYMDAAAWFAPVDLAQAYVEELARAWGGKVYTSQKGNTFTVYKNGSAIKLADIIDKLDLWPPIIQRFQQAITERLQAGEAQPSPSSVYA